MSIEQEISKIRALYATYFDGRDADSFISLFAEDGILVVPGGKEIVGHERLARLVNNIPPSEARHIPIDAEIVVNGETAHCRGPYRMDDAGTISTGQYDDRFVLTATGWRFARRAILPDA